MRTHVLVLMPLLFGLWHPLTARGAEPARAGGYSLELIDEAGKTLPTFESGGRTYVLGTIGRRYSLRLMNATGQRVELVASVDGRDVVDGQPSDWGKRGYIVNAYGEVVIDGFRLNDDAVAAFRFSSVKRSYAARMGDARDVGVIGVAVFPERPRITVARPPHLWGDMRSANEGAAQAAPSAAAGAPVPMDAAKKAESRRGLGTEFGEQRDSRVTEIEFQRAGTAPVVLLSVRYNDCAGLLAMGVEASRSCCPVQNDVSLRQNAEPFRRNPSFSQPPLGWTGG